MRGAFDNEVTLKRVFGITPAHAGSIYGDIVSYKWDEDHPRACGEHKLKKLLRGVSMGSPPRMRGALLNAGAKLWMRRITPAHAGSINHEPRHSMLPRDHPRACGEHVPELHKDSAFHGSPPRMRGAFRKSYRPSAAGGSPPRMRGASTPWSLPTMTMGSPPRMRGAWYEREEWILNTRITPAHAGSMETGRG